MKKRDIFAQIATGGFAALGLFICMISVVEGDMEPFAAGSFMIGTGGLSNFWFRKRAKKRIQLEREQDIMRMFMQSGDQFSLAEVAVALNISVDDTRKIMEELQEKGVFEITATEHGALVYSIPAYHSAYLKNPQMPQNGGW